MKFYFKPVITTVTGVAASTSGAISIHEKLRFTFEMLSFPWGTEHRLMKGCWSSQDSPTLSFVTKIP